eukprot:SAG31_NODE_13901_length_838_cov_1.810555_1_plen_95_part_10
MKEEEAEDQSPVSDSARREWTTDAATVESKALRAAHGRAAPSTANAVPMAQLDLARSKFRSSKIIPHLNLSPGTRYACTCVGSYTLVPGVLEYQ